jgi:hypothetical protein
MAIPLLPGFAPIAPDSILPDFHVDFVDFSEALPPPIMTGAQFTIPVDPRSHSEVAGPSTTVTKQTDGKMRVGATTTPRYVCYVQL